MIDHMMALGLKAMDPVTYYGTVRGSSRALDALKALGVELMPIPRLGGIVCKVPSTISLRGVANAFRGEFHIELYSLPDSFVPANEVVARERSLDEEKEGTIFAYELYLLYQIHSGVKNSDLTREVKRAEITLEKKGMFPMAAEDEGGPSPTVH